MNAIGLDPRTRILLAAFCIFVAALTPKYQLDRLAVLFIIECTVAVVLAFAGRLPVRGFFVIFGAAALPAFLLSSFATLRPGHALARIAPGFVISAEGVVLGAGLFTAACCAACALALVAATTTAPLARRGLRALALPGPMIAIFTFVARQMEISTHETRRISRAARLRGARDRGYLTFLASSGNLAKVFVNSVERGARLDLALAARGFRGEIPDPPLPRLPFRDAAVLAAAAIFTIMILRPA
ncbi:MAG: hypothetical protein HY286_01555 [Planctomycetes bacterium]|nr:hypothetical protein [Planctomycetota bacterium]